MVFKIFMITITVKLRKPTDWMKFNWFDSLKLMKLAHGQCVLGEERNVWQYFETSLLMGTCKSDRSVSVSVCGHTVYQVCFPFGNKMPLVQGHCFQNKHSSYDYTYTTWRTGGISSILQKLEKTFSMIFWYCEVSDTHDGITL